MLLKKLLLHLPVWLVYVCMANWLIMAVAIGGRFLFPWQPMTVFRVYQYGAGICLLCALIALVFLLGSVFFSQVSGRPMLLAVLLSGVLPILAAIMVVKPGGFAAPMIHDITTDTEDPPRFVATRAMRQAGENSPDYGGVAVAEKQKKSFPDIQPVLTDMPPAEALQKALQTAQEMGWTLITVDQAKLHLEAHDTTALFGFVDDVSIRIRPEGAGSRVDIRSASRTGLGDLGANARRIRDFIKKFNML